MTAPSDPTPLEHAPYPLDLAFLQRVYRTTVFLVVLVGALLWEGRGPASALGWFAGAGIGLLVIYGADMSIRKFLNPASRSTRALMAASLLKFLLVGILALGLFYAASQRWINMLWVIPGVTLPYAVVVLKLVGMKLREATAQADEKERRRGRDKKVR